MYTIAPMTAPKPSKPKNPNKVADVTMAAHRNKAAATIAVYRKNMPPLYHKIED